MTKYYTVKLTEAQYNHVLDAMNCYGVDVYDNAEDTGDQATARLHERTEAALMKAQGGK